MIVTATEYIQLYQLRDDYHQLKASRGVAGYVLSGVEDNEWARNQVRDWRARHPLDCECLRPNDRMYLPDGP